MEVRVDVSGGDRADGPRKGGYERTHEAPDIPHVVVAGTTLCQVVEVVGENLSVRNAMLYALAMIVKEADSLIKRSCCETALEFDKFPADFVYFHFDFFSRALGEDENSSVLLSEENRLRSFLIDSLGDFLCENLRFF